MVHSPKFTLPTQLHVFVFDHDEDGKPLYAVAETLDEIPEDHNGKVVGFYTICTERKFRIRRELHD
jgi:hypothetical protein